MHDPRAMFKLQLSIYITDVMVKHPHLQNTWPVSEPKWPLSANCHTET